MVGQAVQRGEKLVGRVQEVSPAIGDSLIENLDSKICIFNPFYNVSVERDFNF